MHGICTSVSALLLRLSLVPGSHNQLGQLRQSSRSGPGTKIHSYSWTCEDGHVLKCSCFCLRDGGISHLCPTATGQQLTSPQSREATAFYPKVSSCAEFSMLSISSSLLLQIPKPTTEWKDQKTSRSRRKSSATYIVPLCSAIPIWKATIFPLCCCKILNQ